MRYKHGDPVINFCLWFRIASVLTLTLIFPLAFLINMVQHSTRYKYRYRIYGIKSAITISNHTTVLDPVKIGGLLLPYLLFQTMMEATVEFPVLGTFIRLLGGVPIPKGKSGYYKILESCKNIFKHRGYLHFYPEGECFLYNQQINEFKTGAFRLSANLGIPVIPLVTVFSGGIFKPRSFFGRSIPYETLVVLKPVYPGDYIVKDENGKATADSIKNFAETVRRMMQKEIEHHKGSSAFYRGHMERIRGINDKET